MALASPDCLSHHSPPRARLVLRSNRTAPISLVWTNRDLYGANSIPAREVHRGLSLPPKSNISFRARSFNQHGQPERLVMATKLDRTTDNPWKLKTPPGTSEYTMHIGEKDGQSILVCTVGSTVLHYEPAVSMISMPCSRKPAAGSNWAVPTNRSRAKKEPSKAEVAAQPTR